jgi:hypothetical protein
VIDELEQERIDGEAARQVLDNPAFQKAWAEAENSIVAQMADVKMRDTEMHTRLILALQTLAAVRRHIFTTMETGQLATVQLREPSVVSRVFGR